MMLDYYIKSLTRNIERNNIDNICSAHFCLLIELSGVRSDKVIMSLRDHLVDGMSKNTPAKK